MKTLQLRPKIARAFKPLLSQARFKGAKGGRGSGKSRFFSQYAIIESISGHQRFVCGREVQNSIADSVKRLLEDTIEEFGLMSEFKITENEIICPRTESLFVFKGLRNHTVSSIKSMEGFTRLWLEEAQTVSQKSLDVAIPTFRAAGSQIWASWNPGKKTDPIDVFFLENQGDEDFICVEANYFDNPWFPDELRRDMERDKRRDPDKYAHVWLGKYEQRSEARVFRNWKVEEFETPETARFYHGADWGFSIDPTVLIRCWVEGRKLYIDFEAYQVGCEIDHTPALFDTCETARKWDIVADSSRPETISYMRRMGFNISRAIKGAGSIEDGIEFLKSYDIVVHPRCVKTIDEFASYSYKVDPMTDQVLPVLEDKNNHVIDAVRYAVESARRSDGIFTLDMASLEIQPIVIPSGWQKTFALASDSTSVVCLWGAWDGFGTCHIYGELEIPRGASAGIAAAVKARGDWMRGILAQTDSLNTADLKDLRAALRTQGVYVRVDDMTNDAGIMATQSALSAGLVRIFTTLDRLKSAYRTYFMDDNGQPAEPSLHMDAMRALVASGRRYSRVKDTGPSQSIQSSTTLSGY